MKKRDKIMEWLFENFNLNQGNGNTPGLNDGEITIQVFLDEIHICTKER